MQCVGVTTAAHVGDSDGTGISRPLVAMAMLESGTGRKLGLVGLVGGARGGGGVVVRRERLCPRSVTPANENAALVLISTASSSSPYISDGDLLSVGEVGAVLVARGGGRRKCSSEEQRVAALLGEPLCYTGRRPLA